MKKALSVLLSILLVLVLGVTAGAVIYPPDPDGDGYVTWMDARLIMRVTYGYDECEMGSALYKACDFDGDGSVTAADARLTLRRAVELETLTDEQFARADADFDGRITAADARMILRAAVELEDRKDWIKN